MSATPDPVRYADPDDLAESVGYLNSEWRVHAAAAWSAFVRSFLLRRRRSVYTNPAWSTQVLLDRAAGYRTDGRPAHYIVETTIHWRGRVVYRRRVTAD